MSLTKKYSYPDSKGKFGNFGGKFVPETLISALYELEKVYNELKTDKDFLKELADLQKNYNGRPTPLTFAKRLTEHYGKAKIYLFSADANVIGFPGLIAMRSKWIFSPDCRIASLT